MEALEEESKHMLGDGSPSKAVRVFWHMLAKWRRWLMGMCMGRVRKEMSRMQSKIIKAAKGN